MRYFTICLLVLLLGCSSKNEFYECALKLRSAGFYQEHQALTDNELVDLLREKYKTLLAKTVPSECVYCDLMALDDAKYFDIGDGEFIVKGNKNYVLMTESYTKLCPDFSPENIQEIWLPNHVQISFTESGAPYKFNAKIDSDRVDPSFHDWLIGFIKNKDKTNQYVNIIECSEGYGILRTTESEKKQLREIFGFTFE